MKKIILEHRAFGWTVCFYGVERMPEDVEMPLPFNADASILTVAADMRKRFPGAMVFYRNKLGHVCHAA